MIAAWGVGKAGPKGAKQKEGEIGTLRFETFNRGLETPRKFFGFESVATL
jgi:hypothetical protein